MTRPGEVIAEDFKRVFAEEEAARVFDFWNPGPRVAHGEAEMLRGVVVGEGDGFGEVASEDDARVAVKSLDDDIGAG